MSRRRACSRLGEPHWAAPIAATLAMSLCSLHLAGYDQDHQGVTPFVNPAGFGTPSAERFTASTRVGTEGKGVAVVVQAAAAAAVAAVVAATAIGRPRTRRDAATRSTVASARGLPPLRLLVGLGLLLAARPAGGESLCSLQPTVCDGSNDGVMLLMSTVAFSGTILAARSPRPAPPPASTAPAPRRTRSTAARSRSSCPWAKIPRPWRWRWR